MKYKILVVDDETDYLAVIRRVLESAGFEVCAASDAQQALRLLGEEAVDAAVLDVNLPGMSGYELCREIRSRKNIPVLMLTVLKTNAEQIEGFEAGSDDYITKPFSPMTLVARIKAVLRRYAHS